MSSQGLPSVDKVAVCAWHSNLRFVQESVAQALVWIEDEGIERILDPVCRLLVFSEDLGVHTGFHNLDITAELSLPGFFSGSASCTQQLPSLAFHLAQQDARTK